MERVTGLGGIFFKARDAEALTAWYGAHLGVDAANGYADFAWRDLEKPGEIGRTVWSIFPASTDYFGQSNLPFMINYRVKNLDRMLDQLRRAGVPVEKEESTVYGRFAWISDPEGNRIELWEPPEPA